MDKVTPILIETLKRALEDPAEQRLFRSGKLPGLFRGKTGANGEAADRAIREGLLEVVRTEPKGKISMEWVRTTPKAMDFIHQQESPLVALQELRNTLQTTKQGLPVWLEGIHKQIQDLSAQLTSEVQAIAHKLEVLTLRVHEAIDRTEAAQPELSEELTGRLPWGKDILAYLDRRNETGVASACSLAELYHFLRRTQTDLTITDFHNGLRRLSDRGILRLLPHEGGNGLPEPEFALLEGSVTYFYVSRPRR